MIADGRRVYRIAGSHDVCGASCFDVPCRDACKSHSLESCYVDTATAESGSSDQYHLTENGDSATAVAGRLLRASHVRSDANILVVSFCSSKSCAGRYVRHLPSPR